VASNRTKEEILMENKLLLKILFPCEACGGSGTLDDAEPGDIGFNRWDCPACGGFDSYKAKRELEDAYG
jgi:hypothetical protein